MDILHTGQTLDCYDRTCLIFILFLLIKVEAIFDQKNIMHVFNEVKYCIAARKRDTELKSQAHEKVAHAVSYFRTLSVSESSKFI